MQAACFCIFAQHFYFIFYGHTDRGLKLKSSIRVTVQSRDLALSEVCAQGVLSSFNNDFSLYKSVVWGVAMLRWFSPHDPEMCNTSITQVSLGEVTSYVSWLSFFDSFIWSSSLIVFPLPTYVVYYIMLLRVCGQSDLMKKGNCVFKGLLTMNLLVLKYV